MAVPVLREVKIIWSTVDETRKKNSTKSDKVKREKTQEII